MRKRVGGAARNGRRTVQAGSAEIESRVRVNAGKPQGANGAVWDEVAGRQGRRFDQRQNGAKRRMTGWRGHPAGGLFDKRQNGSKGRMAAIAQQLVEAHLHRGEFGPVRRQLVDGDLPVGGAARRHRIHHQRHLAARIQ